MSSNKWRPRLSVDIKGNTYRRLKQLIPHGLMKSIMNTLLEDLVEVLQKDPEFIIGAILKRNIKVGEILEFNCEPIKDDIHEESRYKLRYILTVVKRVYKKKESYGCEPSSQDYCHAIRNWLEEGVMPEEVE